MYDKIGLDYKPVVRNSSLRVSWRGGFGIYYAGS